MLIYLLIGILVTFMYTGITLEKLEISSVFFGRQFTFFVISILCFLVVVWPITLILTGYKFIKNF